MTTITPLAIKDVLLITPKKFGDERGFFSETFSQKWLADTGYDPVFVQDNHSRSRQGIVRGMHFQPGQAKLIRCVRGSILDVIVDIQRGSPQFGQWESFVLDDVEHRQLFCPDGFAHGFCVLSEAADVTYKVSTYYDPQAESGFAFNDPDVAIQWPDGLELIVSERDREAPRLAERAAQLPFEYEP